MTADMRQKSTRAPIRNEADNASRTAVLAVDGAHQRPEQCHLAVFRQPRRQHVARPGPGSAGYAVFGCVVAGMDVVDQMHASDGRRRPDDVPVDLVVVVGTRVAAEGADKADALTRARRRPLRFVCRRARRGGVARHHRGGSWRCAGSIRLPAPSCCRARKPVAREPRYEFRYEWRVGTRFRAGRTAVVAEDQWFRK